MKSGYPPNEIVKFYIFLNITLDHLEKEVFSVAKVLPAIGDLTAPEIAYRFDSRSPVYFSQVFKNTFGESPYEKG